MPILWRSELRSILAGYLRDGSFSRTHVARVMNAVEDALAGKEHLVPRDKVFKIVESSRLSAYDCEFVALAAALSSPLVTADRAVLKAYPEITMSMEAFLAM